MDENAAVGVSTSVGAGIGALLAFAVSTAMPERILIATVAGGGVGLIVGLILFYVRVPSRLRAERRQRRRRDRVPVSWRSKKSNRSAMTPPPFRQRLAQFTHQDESNVMVEEQPYKSKMPFWSLDGFLARVPPKSARLIRHYLNTIRKLVRRSEG